MDQVLWKLQKLITAEKTKKKNKNKFKKLHAFIQLKKKKKIPCVFKTLSVDNAQNTHILLSPSLIIMPENSKNNNTIFSPWFSTKISNTKCRSNVIISHFPFNCNILEANIHKPQLKNFCANNKCEKKN